MVTALKTLLEKFSKNGLAKFQVENVVLIIKEILTICVRLSEVQQLPTDTPNNILSGLKLFSVDKFKQPFGLLLNQERINDMYWLLGIYDTSEITLERVKYIFLKAVA